MKKSSRRLGHLVWLIAAFVAIIAVVGCGKSSLMDKPALGKVKTVALVGFTTPRIIKFYDNPREQSEPLLAMAINAAMPVNGPKAATLAHDNFVQVLNEQNLGFRVMTRSEMMKNSEFKKLAGELRARSLEAQSKKETSVGAKIAMTMMFGGTRGPRPAASPDGLPQFGLNRGYYKDSAKIEKDEKDFLILAAKVLNVDAVMEVTDPGFSFNCDVCVGGTGSATTGSGFQSIMVDREGKAILALHQWFITTKGSAVVAAYLVNPGQWDNLFREHGKKLANVWADQYKEDRDAK